LLSDDWIRQNVILLDNRQFSIVTELILLVKTGCFSRSTHNDRVLLVIN